MAEVTLFFEFIDQSENFAYGFECGRIWEIIKSGETISEMMCNSANVLMINQMCRMFNCNYEIEPIDENWIKLNIFKTEVNKMQ